MQKKQFILLFLGLLCLSVNLYAIPVKQLPRKYKKIKQYLDKTTKNKLAGVSIYIQRPKHGEWTASSGYANLEHKEFLHKDHIFSMASIGKMYNAVAVLKLVEEGKIHLDDKIGNYLPAEIINSLPNAKEVTIRHLLGHTSGFVNYDSDPELNRL